MSDSILEPVVDALYNSLEVLYHCIAKCIDVKHIDWNKFFRNANLKNKDNEFPNLKIKSKTDYYDIFEFELPYSITLNDFKNKRDEIAQLFKTSEDNIRLENKNGLIQIKVRNRYKINLNYEEDRIYGNKFEIPLGVDFEGNLIMYNITLDKNYGCYISGSAGSGKSVQLRLILSHLVNHHSKRDIELIIVNTKRVDLKEFQYSKHCTKYMVGTEGIEDFLEEEIEIMNERYEKIEKANCDDIHQYRKEIIKIPYRILVVEEISAYKDNKKYQKYMTELISMGRGAGIIPIMVTQLPSKDIMPNVIKCNVSTTIGLKTKDKIRSDIIMGDADLHLLKGNGHSKLTNGDYRVKEYQSFFISKEQMKKIIDRNRIRVDKGGSLSTLDKKKIY